MKNSTRICWRAVTLPKQGNSAAENEDAFKPDAPSGSLDGQKEFVCALADGTTQTTFSGLWARLLVRAVAATYPDGSLADRVSTAQTHWANALSRTALPWHAEEKVRLGAFSTLAWFGLKMSNRVGEGAWKAVIIGDSCLFQIRNRNLVRMFPEYDSVAFSRSPLLLSSIPARNTRVFEELSSFTIDGNWVVDDHFLLMTAALACWTVNEMEKGHDPFVPLRDNILKPDDPEDAFKTWLDGNRRDQEIKNGDTTLLWVSLEEDQPAPDN